MALDPGTPGCSNVLLEVAATQGTPTLCDEPGPLVVRAVDGSSAPGYTPHPGVPDSRVYPSLGRTWDPGCSTGPLGLAIGENKNLVRECEAWRVQICLSYNELRDM